MAVKFNFKMVYLTFTWTINVVILLLDFHCLMCTKITETSINQDASWFKSYENVSCTVRLVYNVNNTRLLADEINFQTSKDNFRIKVFRENIASRYWHSTDTHLNSKVRNSVLLHKGFLVGKGKHEVLIKIIRNDLELAINTDNDTLILEPLSKYFNIPQRSHQSASGNERHFSNIFYKGSDVLKRINLTDELHLNADITNLQPQSFVKEANRAMRSTSRTECTLHLVADHTFYAQTGHSSVAATIVEMIYLVQQADLIFRGTDFDADNSGDNIGFHISNITIFDSVDSYLMGSEDDVGKYLEQFAEYDFDNYCLATAFSSKDFDDGVIGLAWLASSNIFGAGGGICQKKLWYKSKYMSLNTNLVTNSNNNIRMPTYVTVLTLAHEFGHSFGSPHDKVDNTACVPNNEYGNFMMYPYASDGNKPNNNIFSPCSISYMYPVIRNKGYCFREPIAAVCGNGIIETGEECDCGTSHTCAYMDHCCTPSDVSESDPDPPCTLRWSRGSQCTPDVSPCCLSNCLYIPAASNTICKAATECAGNVFCNGTSAICPAVMSFPDGTSCANGRKTCYDGTCKTTVCSMFGRESCDCDSVSHACHLCCISNSSICEPMTNEFGFISRATGSSCNDRRGFCSYNGECVLTDPDSTLDRLNEILSQEDMNSVKAFLKGHWYYVLLGVSILVFLTVIFVLTCRKKENVQTDAYMFGKFSRVKREAELQKSYLEHRRMELKALFEHKLSKLDSKLTARKYPRAITRLMVLFPTVDPQVLIQTRNSSGSEEVAVKWLLIRNYPFRQFCSGDGPNEDTPSNSRSPATTSNTSTDSTVSSETSTGLAEQSRNGRVSISPISEEHDSEL